MVYGQYTSPPLFSVQNHIIQDLSLQDQPQSQPSQFSSSHQDSQPQPQVQDQEQIHRQQLPQVQVQPQGHLQAQVQQLTQDQFHRLQQQQQQQLQFFTDLTGTPYQSQHRQQGQQTPAQTPTLEFVQPSATLSSPWDSPTSVFGGFTGGGENASFGAAAAMNALATASVAATYGHYGHGHGHGHENGRVQEEGANLIPSIATIDMMDGSTPGSATSTLTPASAASPVAVRSEFGGQDVQQQHVNDCEDQQGQVRYETPRVIQLVERPPRKSRVQARQRANHQAQASTRSQAQRQNQSKNGQREAQAQSEKQTRSTHAQVVKPTSSPSVSRSSLDIPAAKRSPNLPALVTTVPSPGQWYGIHASGATSQQRITSPASSPVKGSIVINGKNSGHALKESQALPTRVREVDRPYPSRLKQRRTVSGPPAFSGGNMNNGESGALAPVLSNAPSPTHSLPDPPLISTSPTPGPPLSHSVPPAPLTRYLVRTDVHYDIPTNTLTAMLEIPGVPRAAIRIALGNDAKSGVRMVVVRGRMRRVAFPHSEDASDVNKENHEIGGCDRHAEDRNEEVAAADERDEEAGYVVKERKCGEFKRVLVVPPETKPEDIRVSMTDGILFLRYPAGEQSVAGLLAEAQATASCQTSITAHASIVNPTSNVAHARQQTQQVEVARTIESGGSTSSLPTRHGSTVDKGRWADTGGMLTIFRVQVPVSTTTPTSPTPGSGAQTNGSSGSEAGDRT